MAGRGKMSGVARPKERIPVAGNSAPLSQPFAGLAQLREQLPAGPAAAAPEPRPAGSPPPPGGPVARARKLVLHRERKGHGGKTATRIEGLAASGRELDTLCSEFKRALGCGAAVDGSDIVVQGDQVDRLTAFLESRGAQKIIIGS